MGSRFGSSRPSPKPFVPSMTPLMWEWWEMWWRVSSQADTGLVAEGNTPKAYNCFGCCVHNDCKSSFIAFVICRVSDEAGRKSSHGLARLFVNNCVNRRQSSST